MLDAIGRDFTMQPAHRAKNCLAIVADQFLQPRQNLRNATPGQDLLNDSVECRYGLHSILLIGLAVCALKKVNRLFALSWLLAVLLCAAGPSFRSQAQLDEHYHKHGSEFGHISKQAYLQMAQELRDEAAGGPILEARRPDGEFSRFDRRHGYFGAYNPDRTIRTFFIPNDGERYFLRQARRPRS